MAQLMSKDLSLIKGVIKPKHPHTYERYKFRRVSAGLFVFEHKDHTKCSSVTLNNLDTAVPRQFKMKRFDSPHSCDFCYSFFALFGDNDRI